MKMKYRRVGVSAYRRITFGVWGLAFDANPTPSIALGPARSRSIIA
jgi:hypothetical protein